MIQTHFQVYVRDILWLLMEWKKTYWCTHTLKRKNHTEHWVTWLSARSHLKLFYRSFALLQRRIWEEEKSWEPPIYYYYYLNSFDVFTHTPKRKTYLSLGFSFVHNFFCLLCFFFVMRRRKKTWVSIYMLRMCSEEEKNRLRKTPNFFFSFESKGQ
jgi:hypothetical protein